MDLLGLHDAAAVKALLEIHAAKDTLYGVSQQQNSDILERMYRECLTVYAEWFEHLHGQFPPAKLLVAAGRSAAATQSTTNLPGTLETTDQREELVKSMLTAAGRDLPESNRWVLHSDWLSVVACGGRAGNRFERAGSVRRETDNVMQRMLQKLSSSTFMQQMLADSSQTSAEQSAYMSELQQNVRTDAAIPPHCWRLLAIVLHKDIWVVDALHWRLSCYSCHDGPVSVYGKASRGGSHSQLSKSWREPGYHFRFQQLLLPLVLAEAHSTFVLLECSGRVISSGMMNPSVLSSMESRVNALRLLGFQQAALELTAKGNVDEAYVH